MEKSTNASRHIGIVDSYPYSVRSILVRLKITVILKRPRIASFDISNLARVYA